LPLYEYECPEHGCFEVFKFAMEPRQTWPCPECGRASRRKFSSFRMVMGLGFLSKIPPMEAPETSEYVPKWDRRRRSDGSPG